MLTYSNYRRTRTDSGFWLLIAAAIALTIMGCLVVADAFADDMSAPMYFADLPEELPIADENDRFMIVARDTTFAGVTVTLGFAN